MSYLLSACCCGTTPGELECCDCSLSTAYSVASDISWSSTAYDSAGNFGTVDVGFAFSGLTLTADDCVSLPTNPVGQHKYVPFRPSATASGITNAALYLTFSSGLSCTSRSNTGETGDMESASINCFPNTIVGLACHHFRNAKNDAVFNWRFHTEFMSTTTCAGGFTGRWNGCFNFQSAELSYCHGPPSSGWEILQGYLSWCTDQSGPCSALSAQSDTSATLTMSIS